VYQALANGGTRLWVSTTLSSVQAYDIPYEYCGTAVQQQQQQLQQQHSGQLPAADGSSNGPPAAAAAGGGLGSSGSSSNASAIPAGGRTLSGSASGRAVFGSSSMRLRHSYDPGAGGEVPLLSPSIRIEGAPGAECPVCMFEMCTCVWCVCCGASSSVGLAAISQTYLEDGLSGCLCYQLYCYASVQLGVQRVLTG
jgi:hypothetical protein